jgi:hypothetical protein
MSIYTEMVAAGVPIESHFSDMYAPINDITTGIVNRYKCHGGNVETFISQLDDKLWYDVPFAYDPYWEKRK